MEQIIPNDTEVLIFKYIKSLGPLQGNMNFISGVIKSSEISDDLSYHGSPWYVQIYEVLGEDGKIYKGSYGSASGVAGNYFFRTKTGHIQFLKNRIKNNKKEILKIQRMNEQYQEQINLLSNSNNITQNKIKVLK